jgi:DNA-directed RNA polymerase
MCLQFDVRWDPETRLKIGSALLALMLENATIPEGLAGRKTWTPPPGAAAAAGSGLAPSTSSAAFVYTYIKNGLKQTAHVCASQQMVRVLLADRSIASLLLVRVPPMLVPPLPWSSHATGGQLTSR